MTLEQILAQVFPNLPAAHRAEYAPLMEDAFAEFEITTKLRLAAVLGQLGVESRELAVWEESLTYSAKRLCVVWPKRFPTLAAAAPFANNPHALAQKVYGGRMGNRDPDDGFKYRGRTPVQLTGRDMYRDVGSRLGLPLEDNPDLANDKAVAFRAVGCFFRDIKRILHLADQRQFKSVTIAVNGGLTDFDTRQKYYERALIVIPDDFQIASAQPHTVPVLPDVKPSDVHQEIEPEQDATTPVAEPPTDSSGSSVSSAVLSGGVASALGASALVGQASAQSPAATDAVATVQKVKQSWASKITSWWPMVSGPVVAAWLAIKGALGDPRVQVGIVVLFVVGFAVGAWLWNESKKRQAAQQHKLIDLAAAPDKRTVVIMPPPPKAG